MLKVVQSGHPPQLGSRASSGRAWRLWVARYSQGEAGPLGAQPLPRALERAASKAAHFPAFDHPGTDAWAVSSPQEVIDGFAARLRLTLQQAGAAQAALPPRVTTAFWDRRFRETKTLSPVSKASATGLGTHTHTSLLVNPPLG